jgi:hypothetical protein
VAHATQLVGGREARGAAADDRDLLAGVGTRLEAVAVGIALSPMNCSTALMPT